VADNEAIGVGVDRAAATANAVIALPNVKVGDWSRTDLFARSITTFAVAGSAALGLAGEMDDSYLQVFGSNGAATPIALGAFTAASAVRDSAIDVLAGNVTSIAVGAFLGSDLLVGAVLDSQGSLDAGATFTSARSLGTFITKAPFAGLAASLAQQQASASFADSNVVAAKLGTVTLSGVFPDVATDVLDSVFASEDFGLGFLTGPTGNDGTVKINGSAAVLSPPFTLPPKFIYEGF
jgi:hypothetical protein